MMRRCLIFLFALLLVTGSVFAQSDSSDEPSALLNMLSFVPDNAQTRLGSIYYANLSSWFTLLADTPITGKDALLDCLQQEDCPSSETIFRTMPGLTFQDFWLQALLASHNYPGATCKADSVTMQMVCDSPPAIEVVPEVMGFGVFDITDSLEIYPQDGQSMIVVKGDFDRDAIDTAFTARGYALQDSPEHVALWCVAEGCDELVYGRDTIDTANLFGGRIGAKNPLALVEDTLLTTTNIEDVNQMLEAQTTQSSLADAPDMQAAAEALNSIPGTLIQANVIGSSVNITLDIDGMVLQLMTSGATITDDTLKEMLEPFELWRENAVPPYESLVMADVLDDTGRLTVIALVFDSAATAELAAERIPPLMEAYTSFAFQQPVLDIIGERATDMKIETYTSDATGKTVLLLKWWMALPEADSEAEATYQQGGVFPLMLNFLLNRDLGWLASNVILPE